MALPKCPHSDFPFSWKKIPFDLSFLSFLKAPLIAASKSPTVSDENSVFFVGVERGRLTVLTG